METENKGEINCDELAAKVQKLDAELKKKEKEYLYLYADIENA